MRKVSYLVVLLIIAVTTLLGARLTLVHAQTTRDSYPTQYYGSGYLYGQVLGFDQYNYLVPISWAKVIATNGIAVFGASTGGDGYYGMYLPAGYYNVTAIEPGFVPHTIFVAVSDGSSSSINFYLEQSHIPVPEFQPQMMLAVIMAALTATLLAKRTRKRRP